MKLIPLFIIIFFLLWDLPLNFQHSCGQASFFYLLFVKAWICHLQVYDCISRWLQISCPKAFDWDNGSCGVKFYFPHQSCNCRYCSWNIGERLKWTSQINFILSTLKYFIILFMISIGVAGVNLCTVYFSFMVFPKHIRLLFQEY